MSRLQNFQWDNSRSGIYYTWKCLQVLNLMGHNLHQAFSYETFEMWMSHSLHVSPLPKHCVTWGWFPAKSCRGISFPLLRWQIDWNNSVTKDTGQIGIKVGSGQEERTPVGGEGHDNLTCLRFYLGPEIWQIVRLCQTQAVHLWEYQQTDRTDF